MRILSAGESHGQCNIAIVEGFPKGVTIQEGFINQELKRRSSGAGRGKRMSIESDKVQILTGFRNKITLGSPIAMMVKNKDQAIFAQKKDNLKALSIPRPAHADLAGALKFGEKDIRNILERSSARETVARVCAGALCKQFLGEFGIKVASYTKELGPVALIKSAKNITEILDKTKKSKLNTINKETEKKMLKEIEKAREGNDSLGGVIEIWADKVIAGLGSCMHFDRRLDGKLANYLMSIPAIKGVEVGLGFEYARKYGSKTHDEIEARGKNISRKTNNSGGIEGGMSNGEPIVLRIAMKPIATLMNPLNSIDLVTKKSAKAPSVRSDTAAIVACGVIAESMSAIAVTECFLDKFGSDSLEQINQNYKNYQKSIKSTF